VSGRRAPWALAGYAVAVYAFLYAPIVILVAFSFNVSKRNAAWRGFTLDWYSQLFHDREILSALTNSLEVAICATLLSTVIGTLGALALARYEFKVKGLYNALIFLPIVIPEVVMGVALLTLFVSMSATLGLGTVVLAHTAFSVSFVAVVVRARLEGYPRSLDDAAADLGATPWQTFWCVTLPMIFPGVLSGALLAFTLSFDDFVITFFNSGAGATTLPIKVYSMIKFGVTPMINGVSTIMLAVTFTAMVIADRFQRGSAATPPS
jgi:spermidine/putrescine transport system permease protein